MFDAEQVAVIPDASVGMQRQIWRAGKFDGVDSRALAEETPVALVHNASTTAVMMATPADLEDFAIGFSLSEQIIDEVDDVRAIDVVPGADGIEARVWLKAAVAARMNMRRRHITGPTGCGLCGVDSLSQAAVKPRSLADATTSIRCDEIAAGFAELEKQQRIGRQTHAVHAAALLQGAQLRAIREDVGRHNALDKLIGAAARQGLDAKDGVLLLTSRVSVEMVQKAAILRTPIICAVSAPTALAVRVANEAGITLAAIVRADGFEVFTRPDRILM